MAGANKQQPVWVGRGDERPPNEESEPRDPSDPLHAPQVVEDRIGRLAEQARASQQAARAGAATKTPGVSRLAAWVKATKQQRAELEKGWLKQDADKHRDARKADAEEARRRAQVEQVRAGLRQDK